MGKYEITDVTAKMVTYSDEITDAIQTVDYMRSLKHEVEMVNTETGANFYWRAK